MSKPRCKIRSNPKRDRRFYRFFTRSKNHVKRIAKNILRVFRIEQKALALGKLIDKVSEYVPGATRRSILKAVDGLLSSKKLQRDEDKYFLVATPTPA